MSVVSIFPRVSCAVSLIVLAALPVVAQTPDSTSTGYLTRPNRSGTLIKLGTGLTRGLEYYGYSRAFFVPLVVSVEHHVTPAVSVFVNGLSSFNVGRRYRYYDNSRASILGNFGFDAGARYYYNQEKRRRKGRAAGPFVGNYLALQTSSVFNYTYYNSYLHSTLTAVWGMQRRIGKYGWFDAYIGAGVGRQSAYYNSINRVGLVPEIGIKFGLGSCLTRQVN
ncbi:hypothetical protein [uncultured Hymenobacter sp.]|uniref:hypothetical protein n=1 Tax=uncultured Hymenobacter sp. TaxID=170016 RepID=UPI0035CC7B2F